jgi:hypothetical protein
MKKISTDDNFNNYIDKFIDINIEGTIRKFFVSKIDSGSITTNAGILFPNTFSILRESPTQECLICEDPCAFSVPIIELNFLGKGNWEHYGPLINDKINETHDVFVNNHKVCRIDTKVLSAAFNRLWLIPFYSNNVQIPNFFDDRKNSPTVSIQASCVFFDPSFYNSKDWNCLTIQPVSAYNPSTFPFRPDETFWTNFYGVAYGSGYDRDVPNILTNKILLNSTGVSSVSCVPWVQYDISLYVTFLSRPCIFTSCPYLSTDLKFGSYAQPVSTFFIDLNPCQNPTEYSLGFNYDADYYYTGTTTRLAYIGYYPYYGAPALVKSIFYTDCTLSNTIELYSGISSDSTIWYSDLGLTPYTGYFYVVDGNTPFNLKYIVNGFEVSASECPT